MTKEHLTPAQIRRIFGQNLKHLSADSPSIAQLCREIGINRTQFNRYLQGEAFPRPDVLQRICEHFGRDARILLEPIETINRHQNYRLLNNFDAAPFLTKMHNFDHHRIPDGLYHYVVPNMTRATGIRSAVIRFMTLPGGVKVVYLPMSVEFAEIMDLPTNWANRKLMGFCFQHADGISYQYSASFTSFIIGGFFAYGYMGLSETHAGYATITQARGPGRHQVQPAILERIPSLAVAIRIRRRGQQLQIEDLKPAHRDYFENWTPN